MDAHTNTHTAAAAEDRTTEDQRKGLQFLLDFANDRSATARACLKGFVGVGKTWLVGHWLAQVLLDNPKANICIAAPTHKALQVLRTKCQGLPVVFRTVDSLLGFRISRNEDGEIKRGRGFVEFPYDLVAVDEASMLKDEYVTLCNALPCKVLYIGDPAQLPPINEEISAAFKTPRQHMMTQVVRQQADNPITTIATSLRIAQETNSTYILPYARQQATDNRVTFCSRDAAVDWMLKALDKGMDARILAYTNRTVTAYNSILHARLYPQAPLFGEGEWVLVNEAFPVPKQGDDEEEELISNGTMLQVLECTLAEPVAGVEIYNVRVRWPQETSLTVQVGDEPPVTGSGDRELLLQVAGNEAHMVSVRKGLTNRIWDMRRARQSGYGDSAEIRELVALRRPLNKLAPLRHSYACTVHKSQGSTYDAAFVDWSDIYPSEDRLKLLYVAVTRPSKFLVFIK